MVIIWVFGMILYDYGENVTVLHDDGILTFTEFAMAIVKMECLPSINLVHYGNDRNVAFI